MRLIDADALLEMPLLNGQYDRKNANPHFIYGIMTVKELVENAPTIEIPEENTNGNNRLIEKVLL